MKEVETSREVEATMIPEGDKVAIPAGTFGWLTQALGGTYTVQLATGRKIRLEGRDGDAIGEAVIDAQAGAEAEPLPLAEAETMAWDLMRQVHDPEIPINIVELGLVYELKLHERGDGKYLAVVRMSLTAPGCGMGDVLIDDVRRSLLTVPGIASVDAKIVFDPIWDPSMMSEAARLQLGMY